MATIKMTPETLDSKAKELRQLKTEHEGVYSKITGIVNNITEVWEGDSQRAYQQSFTGKAQVFKTFGEEVDAFAQMMETAAKQMREAEAALAQAMRRG